MYKWQFNFDVDNNNVIKQIHWRYNINSDDGSTGIYGSCSGADMDFDSVTQQQCIDCVLENSGETESSLQQKLSNQLNAQLNPEVTSRTKEF
jgi:hypothetical protein